MSTESTKPDEEQQKERLSSGISLAGGNSTGFHPTVPARMGYDRSDLGNQVESAKEEPVALHVEISAMGAISEALQDLDPVTQRRVLSWVVARHNIEI